MLTSDRVELATREWLVDGQARAVVVLVHGFAASKDDRTVVMLAGRLVAQGVDVLSYDARGHGASGGTCTLGDLEAHDVAAAVVWARDRSRSIVLVGASMGGIAVLRHAATNPDVAGVVVVSSPAEWRVPLRVRALVTAGLARNKAGRWVCARRLRVRVQPIWSAPQTSACARGPCDLSVGDRPWLPGSDDPAPSCARAAPGRRALPSTRACP